MEIPTIQIGGAQIRLQNVRLRDDVTLDEVHLEGGEIVLTPPPPEGGHGQVTTGETQFRALLMEPNLNRLLSNPPPDAPVRNLRAAILSDRLRITGQFIKVIPIPFTLETRVRIENGVRVLFDFQELNSGVLALPPAVAEFAEQQLNRALPLDLSKSPVPVYLDEIRCEPGRLTVIGRARLRFPPTAAAPVLRPFSAAAPPQEGESGG